MLFTNTPIGKIQIPEWQEKELERLSDKALLKRALAENKKFVISPAVFAMIEKRGLDRLLQRLINSNVGFRHNTTYKSLEP